MNPSPYILAIILAVLLIAFIFCDETQYVSFLCDQFIEAIDAGNAESAAYLFCKDGLLLTDESEYHSHKILTYLSSLHEFRLVTKSYSIVEIDTNIYLNTARVIWSVPNLPLLHTTMIFSISKSCISQLQLLGFPKS